MTRFQCHCCNLFTLGSPPDGSFEICPVCGWEDDPIQSRDPEYAGGANRVSLVEARQNYLSYGASDQAMLNFVRRPLDTELSPHGNS
ncbi:CPCC family cysteine-rich protein [Variovorax sp. DT-64]|uniref:CPCC family cysteine-rich protein n=1 Tax=Variovorax sp. DT-64 TaxID=3396160 RepID=UPI003F1A9A82